MKKRLGRIVEGSVVVWRGDVSRSGSVWVGRREWEEEEEGQREKKIIKSIQDIRVWLWEPGVWEKIERMGGTVRKVEKKRREKREKKEKKKKEEKKRKKEKINKIR